MRVMRTLPGILIRGAAVGLLALTATALALAQEPADPPTPLDPVTVTGRAAPLDRSLHMLRILVEQSAPCLGCDVIVRQAARPTALRLLSYMLLPAEPPPVTEAERLALEIKLKDSPELEFLRP